VRLESASLRTRYTRVRRYGSARADAIRWRTGSKPHRDDRGRRLAASLRELFDSAIARHRAGDLEAAGRGYERILAAHPDHPDALNLLATVAMEQRRYPAAAELLRRAVAVSGEVAQFHCHLGNALQGSGDLDGATRAYRRAVSLDPRHAEALNNLGFVLIRSDACGEAIEYLTRALDVEPRSPYALNNLGDALRRTGDAQAAVDAYRRAVAAAPAAIELRTKLARVLRDLGRFDEALEHLWPLLDADDVDASVLRLIGSLTRVCAPARYDSNLERRLLMLLAASGIDHNDVAEFAARLVRLKYAGDARFADGSDADFAIDTFLCDALVRALLTRSVNRDAEIEGLLGIARRTLLLGTREMRAHVLEAASVLAQQCFSNEYVLFVGDDEGVRLDALRTGLESHIDWSTPVDDRAEHSLLLFAMYAPLAELSVAERLATRPLHDWHTNLRPLIERTLLEPMEEVSLQNSVPSAGVISDPVSRAVKAQYEANPYPRWLEPAYRDPSSVYGILKSMFPCFEPPAVLRDRIRVLVVGCGTGHHPVSVALRYAGAEVVATDISRRSLAYGVRMARRLGVENVQFVENDALNLGELEGDFHVVECVGVLHHMRAIDEGLRALLGKLRADGVLKLGLYSERARLPLLEARERIAKLGLTPCIDDIRTLRHTALAAAHDDPLRRILEFGDFYTSSSCRDLLFHVHEQCVTLAGVERLLAGAGLRFIGFELVDPLLVDVYRRRFPEDDAMDDVARWRDVEERVPGAFTDMYQFWCERMR